MRLLPASRPLRPGAAYRRELVYDDVRHDEQMTSVELAAAMRRFDEAVVQRDGAAASEVLDENFALVLVHPVFALMPRAQWLRVLPDYVVHSYVIEEQHVDEVEGVAAVLSRIRMQATVLGGP